MKKKQKIKNWLFYEIPRIFLLKSPIYNLLIEKNISTDFSSMINDPWNGDRNIGSNIMKGFFSFFGETVNYKNFVWDKNLGSKIWREELHSFEWVRDIKSFGSSKSRYFLRKTLEEWINSYGNWSEDEWRSDITGKRLCSLIGNLSFYCLSADDQFQKKLLYSFVKQGNHLIRSKLYDVNGFRRIFAIKGIIAVSLSFKVFEKSINFGLELLMSEIKNQVLSDYCHYLKSPSKHLDFLKNLIDIKHYLVGAKIKVPIEINNLIIKMSPIVKFFRSGNGSFVTFNNSNHTDNLEINKVLIRSNSKLKIPKSLNHSGFEKILENKMNFFMDCGSPVKENIYAGSLSFEFSYGKNQLIVNCGSPYINNKKFAEAMKSTAAHSTISVDNLSSSEILYKKKERIAKVWSSRKRQNYSHWIHASHSGYEKIFGLIHSRKIHIDSKNKILRGQDSFIKSTKDYDLIPKKYFLRFHLHPNIEVNITGSKKKAILKLHDGTGFEFICSEPKLEINESIYLSEKQKILKTNHLLVSDIIIPEKKIKWLFRLI